MKRKTCDKAVILAAGIGSRVSKISTGRPKCLIDLGGRPIIAWILDSLRTASIRQVLVVTGFGARALREALGDGGRYGLEIRYVHNRRWKEPNGLSLYIARKALGSRDLFLTMMSDHLLPPAVISRVAGANTSRCVLAVETDLDNVFDIPDATKVRLTAGRPVAIGKRLRDYNAVDCGLFRFDSRIFDRLGNAIRSGRMSLTDGVKGLLAAGDMDAVAVGGSFWIDIDTPRAHREAARNIGRLARLLAGPRKSR
jgi:choline kinase